MTSTGQVARIAPDDTYRRVLTAPAPGEPPEPNWSPDGRRIVFNHAGPYVNDPFTMNRWGGDMRRVTHTRNLEINADWGSKPH